MQSNKELWHNPVKKMTYVYFLGLFPRTIHYIGKGKPITSIDKIFELAKDKKSVWVDFNNGWRVPAAVLQFMQAKYLYDNVKKGIYFEYVKKSEK